MPIDVGAKLTGRIGRSDVGVLAVRTGQLEDVVEPKSLVVARMKWKLFQQSYAGVLFTGGNPASGESGQTYGADLRLTTSRSLGESRDFDVTAYAARSVNAGRSAHDWSWGFSARDSNDKYDAQVVVREIQENFDPALGFVQRDNVRMLRLAASYNPLPRAGPLPRSRATRAPPVPAQNDAPGAVTIGPAWRASSSCCRDGGSGCP